LAERILAPELGKVANIGTKKYSGFTSLNGAINKDKPKSYWILKQSK